MGWHLYWRAPSWELYSEADLHSLSLARWSAPSERARAAAFLVVEFAGRSRTQCTVRWEVYSVCISLKVLNQSTKEPQGMADIEMGIDIVRRVHGFRVLSMKQEGRHLTVKLQATIARMDEHFLRARRTPAFKSTLQAMLTGLLFWWVGSCLWYGWDWWCGAPLDNKYADTYVDNEADDWEFDDGDAGLGLESRKWERTVSRSEL